MTFSIKLENVCCGDHSRGEGTRVVAATANWLRNGDVTLESEKQTDLGYEFGTKKDRTY